MLVAGEVDDAVDLAGGAKCQTSAQAVQHAARDRSVGLYGMRAYRSSGATTPPQLVLGFGNLSDLLQAGA